MEAPADSKSYLDQICYPVEKYLIGYTQPKTVIPADRFEMLIAVIYPEKGTDAVKDFLKSIIF